MHEHCSRDEVWDESPSLRAMLVLSEIAEAPASVKEYLDIGGFFSPNKVSNSSASDALHYS